MPTWNSDQYLKFARERTQPALDLAARIELDAPALVADLGCGPGNSTAVLAQRWPSAALTGIDSSPAMLAAARRDFPGHTWTEHDLTTWTPDQPYHVVFTNAALQWVPDHAALLPRLFGHVAPGGAFAMQVPANAQATPHRLMRELAASTAWRRHFNQPAREWRVESASFYYDTLSSQAAQIELWETHYIHVLPDPAAIVDWYRGTGLRPWLDLLPDDTTRERFLADYLQLITDAFPCQADGRVLFPFHRLFLVAYRPLRSGL
ncbi:MAG: tam 2 [Rariglobus sp.]|jgi:trans-aconitate 2-methyltransferase|nr:tam 2 [Rariglobus sp.]